MMQSLAKPGEGVTVVTGIRKDPRNSESDTDARFWFPIHLCWFPIPGSRFGHGNKARHAEGDMGTKNGYLTIKKPTKNHSEGL